jgi:tetratricopeptide (TPR) repeat protein
MSESNQDGAAEKSTPEAPLGAPTWVLLILLAVAPAAFATGLSNFEALKELLLVGGMGLATVMWGIGTLRRRASTLTPGRVVVLMLLFAAYALAATLWADNRLLGLWESLHFVALAAAALIVSAPIGRPLRFKDLAAASGIGAAIAALFGILDLAGVGIFTVVWDPAGPTGPFDAMEFGVAYYVVVLPILLAAAIRFAGRARILFGLSTLLAAFHFALLSSWVWAAIFAGVCVLSAFIVGALRRPQSLKVIVSSVILAAIVGVFMAVAQFGLGLDTEPTDATSLPQVMESPRLDLARIERAEGQVQNMLFSADRTESVRDWEAHSYLLAVGGELFADKPVVGRGAGSWWPSQTSKPVAEHPYVLEMFEHYPAFRSPHNGLLKILVEYGLVGLMLFGLWLLAAFAVALGALVGGGAPGEHGKGEPAQGAQANWVLEHWAMLSAALAGLAFMLFTPLLSLAPAALVWVLALAVLARVSAGFNDFRGWSRVWQASAPKDGEGRNRALLKGGAAAAVVVGLGILVPTVLNTGAAFHRGRADQLMRATVYEEAIEAYKAAHSWYPAYGDAAINIGLASTQIGRLIEAEEWVHRAAEMRPHDVRAIVLKGRMLLRHPDTPMVVGLGNQAVAAFPNSVEARNLLISALDLQARYEEAAIQANELIKRGPPPAQIGELHKLVGDLYADFLGNPAKALRHYKAAIKFTQSREMQAKLQQKVDKIGETLDRRRRLREGKPVRPTPPDAAGHQH